MINADRPRKTERKRKTTERGRTRIPIKILWKKEGKVKKAVLVVIWDGEKETKTRIFSSLASFFFFFQFSGIEMQQQQQRRKEKKLMPPLFSLSTKETIIICAGFPRAKGKKKQKSRKKKNPNLSEFPTLESGECSCGKYYDARETERKYSFIMLSHFFSIPCCGTIPTTYCTPRCHGCYPPLISHFLYLSPFSQWGGLVQDSPNCSTLYLSEELGFTITNYSHVWFSYLLCILCTLVKSRLWLGLCLPVLPTHISTRAPSLSFSVGNKLIPTIIFIRNSLFPSVWIFRSKKGKQKSYSNTQQKPSLFSSPNNIDSLGDFSKNAPINSGKEGGQDVYERKKNEAPPQFCWWGIWGMRVGRSEQIGLQNPTGPKATICKLANDKRKEKKKNCCKTGREWRKRKKPVFGSLISFSLEEERFLFSLLLLLLLPLSFLDQCI